MNRTRRTYVGALITTAVIVLDAGCAAGGAPAAKATCRQTVPNGSTPPGERRNPVHHGSGGLWTQLPLKGQGLLDGVRFVPGDYVPRGEPGLHRDGTATDKFYWWGSRKAARRLRITGRRLDGSAKPLRAQIGAGRVPHAPHFWPTYLTFPKSGCWRVTATSGNARLAFRVAVVIPPLQ